jgi:hypothetical protein
MALTLCVVTACSSLAAAFDKNVTLWNLLAYTHQPCLGAQHTFKASFLEKLLSQWVHGKGLTAK